MRLLLDTSVWGGAVDVLVAAGHDVESIAARPQDPGDEAILAEAHREGRVLVTLDKDFGELAVVRGRPHAGIVRLVGFRGREQGPVCAAAVAKYATELALGAIATVERGRVRVRLPDED